MKQAINWHKFDENVDVDALNEDIENSKEGFGEFKEVPLGVYEVQVNKMELKTSKKGDPMVAIRFKILAGKFKNSLIFYNQVVNLGFQIHLVNEFLRSLDTELDIPSKFEGYAKLNDLILDVSEEIDAQGLEYALDYGENDKGFNTFKIKEVFEKE